MILYKLFEEIIFMDYKWKIYSFDFLYVHHVFWIKKYPSIILHCPRIARDHRIFFLHYDILNIRYNNLYFVI